MRTQRVERRASKSVRGKREISDVHGLGPSRPVPMTWRRMRSPNPASKPQLFPGSIYMAITGSGENEESNERKLADDAVGARHDELGDPPGPSKESSMQNRNAAMPPSDPVNPPKRERQKTNVPRLEVRRIQSRRFPSTSTSTPNVKVSLTRSIQSLARNHSMGAIVHGSEATTRSSSRDSVSR